MKLDPAVLEIHRPKPEEKVFVVSFPKSGRTWLRVLLSRYKQVWLDVDRFHLKLHSLYSEPPKRSPQFIFYHGRASMLGKDMQGPFLSKMKDLLFPPEPVYEFDLSLCEGSPRIFLARSPYDTLVSYYHQLKDRRGDYRGSLSRFVKDPNFGIARIVAFMNFVAGNFDETRDMMVFYEDLHADTRAELERMLAFAEMEIIPEFVEEAVRYASFENMRQMEVSGDFGAKLSPTDLQDKSTYKVRKGKIGSYKSELSPGSIEFIKEFVSEHLDQRFSRYM